MSGPVANDAGDDPEELADFDAGLSEQRGERDLALFFDRRWIHGQSAYAYVAAVLASAGVAFEGRWTRYGYFDARGTNDDTLWRMFMAHVEISRPFDFPGKENPLVVAQLDGVDPTTIERCLSRVCRDAAFVGAADVSFVSELRVFLSRELDWV